MIRVHPRYLTRQMRANQRFRVRLSIYVVGPVRPRTKYKENKVFSAEQCISLPFVPYQGMNLTMEKLGRRNYPLFLYLRIRSVDWLVPAAEFRCAVDEVLGDPSFSERDDVRGPVRIEKHYAELQRTFEAFGFNLTMNVTAHNRIAKYADGTWIDPEGEQERERLVRIQIKELRAACQKGPKRKKYSTDGTFLPG